MRPLHSTNRWQLCVVTALLVCANNENRIALASQQELVWHPITASQVHGLGWKDTEFPFDRLPARAKALVRAPVWDLARHSSGVYVDFETDSSRISIRWSLTSDRLAMSHMPATGVSGVDLYLNNGSGWHYLSTGRPNAVANTIALATELPTGLNKYRIYFPLYNGTKSLEIGVAEGAEFRIADFTNSRVKPVVIYGTSITQGGCASRPGMSYSAILGRRLGVRMINLGFSGNGKAEPEVAELIAELDPSVFILDPLPNLFADDVSSRLPEFIKILRSKHPDTPILLVESPLFPDAIVSHTRAERVEKSNVNLRQIHSDRVALGDRHLWLVPSCNFTLDGGEDTVDSLHPTDTGFIKLADTIEIALRDSNCLIVP